SPTVTTTYTLTVYENGCSSTNLATVTITVLGASTTTTLSSNRPSTLTTQPPIFTAVVAPMLPVEGAPTGEVEFLANGQSLGRSPIFLKDGQYVAIRGGASLGVGNYTITASYLGDASFEASSSASVPQSMTAGGYYPVSLGTL